MVVQARSLLTQPQLRGFICLLTLVAAFLAPLAQAKITASVDRNTISEQDIISLTLRSDSGSIPDNLDLSALERDFEILNRQQKSEISFINGQRSANYDLIFVIAPKRAGKLTVPSFLVDGETTTPIQVRVTPGATDPRAAKSEVFLDSAVSKQEVYVQERFLYRLKVYHSVGLDNANITPIDIENALVKQIGGQQKYETIIDGVRYSVIEIKYSVAPQSSGRLIIPEQVLTATALTLHGSIFRSDNRRIRSKSPTQIINVLPKPANYPADQPWLPTEQLTLEDSWADRSIKLHLGAPQTRTISIKAIGLDSAQLPSFEYPESEGLKIYPDQPVLNDQETSTGVNGERSLSAALVPNREGPVEQEGTYPLPEAQLDRFLMHVTIDYPDIETERRILKLVRGEALAQAITGSTTVLSQESVFSARKEVLSIHMSETVEEYIVQLVMATREAQAYNPELANWIEYGASPRATISLDRCARAHAWLQGKDFVTPDDVQAIVHDVIRHRIILSFEAEANGYRKDSIIDSLLDSVPAP